MYSINNQCILVSEVTKALHRSQFSQDKEEQNFDELQTKNPINCNLYLGYTYNIYTTYKHMVI